MSAIAANGVGTSIRPKTLRVGSVSFLNAKPLIWGLGEQGDIDLSLAVPSKLIDGLRDRSLDVALLPVIDYQRLGGLCVVPSGGIGCDGETLTVRIFSTRPVERIRTLACDTDSHTSVALARVIFAERYGIRPEFVDWHREGSASPQCDARLLIGDKVVCEEPAGFEHQVDLGSAWKALTGLPFVFAVWTARQGVELGDLPARLERAKRGGLGHVREIVEKYAVGRGWPAGLAWQYLTVYLKFDVGPREMEAIRLFHQLAAKHGAIAGAVREVEVYNGEERH
ncbi:MAG TPA: menaquinone biosynthesis protein [Tepidisphaeraceae bacterium]|nr:menaquinone biosynthesis protein [Tepidisphaeraceae bacterium]